MAEAALRSIVLKRLEQDTQPEDAWSALVLAALEGGSELEALLGGQAAAKAAQAAPATPESQAAPNAASPAVAFLRSITVQGFRGIGPAATLELAPGPGLTLVVGRNGSGKSSFAEALELLLTGDTYRWLHRTKVWQEGWRNLHHPHARIEATLALEGQPGPCTLAREWPDEAALDQAAAWIQPKGKPRTEPATLGWDIALTSYRPFLSYNELGSLLDEGPAKLYDALTAILGLDSIVEAQTHLKEARATRERALKEADAQRKEILTHLQALPDERATRAATALQAKAWDLTEIERLLAAEAPSPDGESEIDILRRLATLPLPGQPALDRTTAALREAAASAAEAAESVAARADELASILDSALRFHDHHGDADCPVCGQPAALSSAWHERKQAEVLQLRREAAAASDARKAVARAIEDARQLPAPDPRLLERGESVALDTTAAREALADWLTGLSNKAPQPLADHIERAGPLLAHALTLLRDAATAELDRRQDAWRPHATRLAAWLPGATAAVARQPAIKLLKQAEAWLKDAADSLRDERFAPVADHAIRIWEQLRVQSNVTLGSIQLEGQGNRRRVALNVTVDGQDGAALGVMSQGELHSLALSLFIPRAALPESPFRFIVVDDPVQSMDPARVDGLARVLQAAGRDRQVVVFTHDDRLPEAIRRLAIDATIIEVTRAEGSIVQTRRGLDAVARSIQDALALAKTDDLPADAARRVIPGLCRMALEAACMETVRRRRIGKGERHTDVEALLVASDKLNKLAALALYDTTDRIGDVLPRINRDAGRSAGDAYVACNKGAHEALDIPALDLVRTTEKLAAWMRSLP